MSVNGEVLFQIDNLCKSFGANLVLDHISTEIRSGEVVVIVGPSGSGKSTFLRSLNLLEVPTQGTILFEGMNITDKKTDINQYRQKIGMVFQHFNLFPHKTILENLTLAPIKLLKKSKKEAEAEARALLKRVGLEEKENAYPAQLSGGQKQRIAIVRSLAMPISHPMQQAYATRRQAMRALFLQQTSQIDFQIFAMGLGNPHVIRLVANNGPRFNLSTLTQLHPGLADEGMVQLCRF